MRKRLRNLYSEELVDSDYLPELVELGVLIGSHRTASGINQEDFLKDKQGAVILRADRNCAMSSSNSRKRSHWKPCRWFTASWPMQGEARRTG